MPLQQSQIKLITRAYQKIADAHQQALKEIADAARTVMIDIQAAASFPGTALSLSVANNSGTLSQENSSDAVSHGAGEPIVPSPYSPHQYRDPNNIGGVSTSQPNVNASSSTPPTISGSTCHGDA